MKANLGCARTRQCAASQSMLLVRHTTFNKKALHGCSPSACVCPVGSWIWGPACTAACTLLAHAARALFCTSSGHTLFASASHVAAPSLLHRRTHASPHSRPHPFPPPALPPRCSDVEVLSAVMRAGCILLVVDLREACSGPEAQPHLSLPPPPPASLSPPSPASSASPAPAPAAAAAAAAAAAGAASSSHEMSSSTAGPHSRLTGLALADALSEWLLSTRLAAELSDATPAVLQVGMQEWGVCLLMCLRSVLLSPSLLLRSSGVSCSRADSAACCAQASLLTPQVAPYPPPHRTPKWRRGAQLVFHTWPAVLQNAPPAAAWQACGSHLKSFIWVCSCSLRRLPQACRPAGTVAGCPDAFGGSAEAKGTGQHHCPYGAAVQRPKGHRTPL